MSLRISTPAEEGVYQGSKYLKFQVLCDEKELALLFERLGEFSIYPLTGLVDGAPIDRAQFLKEYAAWIEGLKNGRVPNDAELRKILAAAMTMEAGALWRQATPGDRFLVKIGRPVIQIQAHFFTFSPIDGVFRPMTMGSESVFWGLQFSYPQIYQDPKTMEFLDAGDAPNSELFQRLRLWVRDATRATPFEVDGKRVNAPIRIGKNCLSWIHSHPQLISRKIGIFEAAHAS